MRKVGSNFEKIKFAFSGRNNNLFCLTTLRVVLMHLNLIYYSNVRESDRIKITLLFSVFPKGISVF